MLRGVAPEPTRAAPLVVDVHAHTFAPDVADLVTGAAGLEREIAEQLQVFGAASMAQNARLAAEIYPPMLLDVEVRLGVMDRAGVGVQAVSITPTQYHYFAEPGLASELVALANSHVARLVARRPDRLVGLATVALQHPDLAAEQLVDAMTTLDLRGVVVSSAAGGREFSDPAFEPLWCVAEDLGAFVFIHPWGCSLGARLDSFYLGNVIGQPIETTVALSHLIFGGVLDRHPSLVVCGAHGGGYLPYYIGRADHSFEVRPESRTMRRRPSEYLGDLYFDALVYRPDTLSQLLEVAGPSQVLLGTDYPFDMGISDPLERLAGLEGLSVEAREQIAGATAARLLRIDTTNLNAKGEGR